MDKNQLPESILRKSVEELEISTRSLNALQRRGVETVGQLLELTDEQLLRFKNFGRHSLVDVRTALAKLFCLSDDIPAEALSILAPPGGASGKSAAIPNLISEGVAGGWVLPERSTGRLDADIDSLDLSVRAVNVLRTLHIQRIAQLVNFPKSVLFQQGNCGRKTLNEIEARLFEYLQFGVQASFRVREDVQALGTRALVEKLFSYLPERSRNVLADRYGLWDGIAETLEDVGSKLGLTRERIRQIESKALKRLRRILGSSLREFILAKATKNIAMQQGFMNEEELIQAFSDDCTAAEAILALDLFRDLEGVTDLFARNLIEVEPGVYCSSAETAGDYKMAVALVQGSLSDSRAPIDQQQLWNRISEHSTGGRTPPREVIRRIVQTSPSFSLLQNDAIILSRWTASTKSRLATFSEGALQRLGNPTHFTEIARKIKQMYREAGDFSEASVHNVLVARRDIFVWVKNGTYGLASWGLKQPPYIKDRLVQLLSESAYPLPYWFLKEKTLEACNCKESSVRMTLDLNSRVFKKFTNDQYGLVSKPGKEGSQRT